MQTDQHAGLTVISPAFGYGGDIPRKYACEGENVNPSLAVEGFPSDTRSLALIVEDPDAPKGTFDHWLVWNIPPNEAIAEGSVPGISGRNGFGKTGYGGPCPPSGRHRYFFRLYALDTFLDIPPGSRKDALHEAMEGHVLASGELMGYYHKTGGL